MDGAGEDEGVTWRAFARAVGGSVFHLQHWELSQELLQLVCDDYVTRCSSKGRYSYRSATRSMTLQGFRGDGASSIITPQRTRRSRAHAQDRNSFVVQQGRRMIATLSIWVLMRRCTQLHEQ